MNVSLVVDGKSMQLTKKEACAALHAIRGVRKSLAKLTRPSVREEIDMEIWSFHRDGMTDAEIGREFGITARSVRGALGRVEAGRYAHE